MPKTRSGIYDTLRVLGDLMKDFMNNFWQQLEKPFFILAPMEAVTDVVFRHVVEKAGRPDVYFSEFTNATGWTHAGDKAIGGRLVKTDDERPIVAQLWGADPESMTKMAKHCKELGYDGIDINMGCPDASAVKSGGGAGMIRTPDLAYEMISAARTSGLPVSVKTRLGYSRTDEWREWLGGLLAQNLPVLTIHLRTKKEMSKVPAHYELIPEIVALKNQISPETLLVINGDIRDRSHGMELFRQYGVDGVMIGRGIFADPFCFSEQPPVDDKSDKKQILINLLHFHLDQYDKYSHLTKRPYDTLKRFYKIYIRDFDGAAEMRDKLMHTKSTDDVRAILREK